MDFCHGCYKKYTNNSFSLQNYCYAKGWYRGFVYKECNSGYKVIKKTVSAFGNLIWQDFQLLMKEMQTFYIVHELVLILAPLEGVSFVSYGPQIVQKVLFL